MQCRWGLKHALRDWIAAELLPKHSKECSLLLVAQYRHYGVSAVDRLCQGHHRDLYSRDDTIASLAIQEHVRNALLQSWRPQRSQARGAKLRSRFWRSRNHLCTPQGWMESSFPSNWLQGTACCNCSLVLACMSVKSRPWLKNSVQLLLSRRMIC